jgi:chromosome segregation ATPase
MRAAILFCLAAGSRSLQTDRTVSFAADSSPVSKVIKLLKDMQEQLLSDKKAEEEMYDKLSCWCKVNGGGKETAITTAEQMIQDLSARIKALDAKSSELEMSIKSLTDEVASNTASLAAATKMREEEHAAFNTNEKDMILSIDSLKNAIVVLAKSQGDGRALKSFLQTDSSMVSLASVKRRLRHVVDKTEDLLNQILAPKERNALDEFMQTQGGYAPASGEIYGVLKQMRENFDANLKDMQSAESKSSAEYAALKAAKSEEIAAGEKLAKEKEAQLGKTKVELSEAKEDLTDTENSLSADQAFLQDLKERCSVSDAEWEKRSAVRTKEIAAVGEAIGILTDDDAHDLFHKSLSFLQLSSTRRVVTKAQRAREAASRVLLRQGQKSDNKALVQLAAAARLDSFGKVTESIEGMMKDLKAEMADEIKHRDYCNKEFLVNEKETFTVTNEIKDLETKINDFASEMDTLATEIATVKA